MVVYRQRSDVTIMTHGRAMWRASEARAHVRSSFAVELRAISIFVDVVCVG